MFRNRLIYRLFFILLVFAVASILPIAASTQKEVKAMIAETGGDTMVIKRITDNYIAFAFYVFILAFLLSLFMSRKLLLPVRELHRGAISVRDGDLETTLTVQSKDEFGEVVEVFNEMAASLKDKTEELGKKNKELIAINSIAALLGKSLDEKGAIRNVVGKLLDMLDMDDGGVLLMDRDNMELVCYQTEKKMPYGGNIPSMVIETGVIHACSDITKDGGEVPEWLKDANIKGCCCVPLRGKERILGALYLISFEPHHFTEEEKRVLNSVGDMTGMALENIRLYEDMSHLMLTEKGLAEIVFNSISDGLYTVDTDSVITSFNTATERILGIPAKDIIGRRCSEVVAPLVTGSDERLCEKGCPLSYALNGTQATTDADYIDPAGKRMSLHISCSPLIDAKGSLIGAVQVFRDITKEKEIDRMKTEFVKTVSHEFKTPLSAIVGMAEMLIEKEVAGVRANEYLYTIMDEGVRLTGMVTDLLNIARIESGEEIFNESAIDFNLLLHDIKKTFLDIIKRRKGRLETYVADDIGHFRGDREKLKQLLINLVANSLNYSDNGCLINIKVEREADKMIIEASDTGWGIPPEDIPHLAKKFYRGKHGLKAKGTGLGLSICKEIARLHGGSINISSMVGKGTTVTVSLPWKN